MKKLITITSLLTAGTLFTSAGTTTAVIDFGNGLTTETSGKVADYTFNANNKGSSTASNVQLGVLTLNSGSLFRNQNVSAKNPTETELFGEAAKYFGDYSANVWADGLKGPSAKDNNTMSLSFNNLQANTKYIFALFSGFGDGTSSSFGFTHLYLSFKSGLKNGSDVDYISGTHFKKDGSAEGEQFNGLYTDNAVVSLTDQHLFVWEFETGSEITKDTRFVLYSTKGVINALSISATPLSVPEPSAFGLLAGLGVLALVGARRRRK